MTYYFDNSSTTPLLPEVIELMNEINESFYGNPSSIYAIGRKSKIIIENAREKIASFIKAEPNQIIFTSSGTESNNQVLWSFVGNKRNHVISSLIEHPAVTKVLQRLNEYGLEYDLIDVDKRGVISIPSLKSNIRPSTGLISIMLANNELGTIQPLDEVINIAKENDILVHSDAVQCFGKVELNMSTLLVDFLSLSSHKFYGPKGVGILYVRNPKRLKSFVIGGSQENGLRAGTENISSIAGTSLAAEKVTKSMYNKKKHIYKLEARFKSGLFKIYPKAIYNGSQKKKLPGLLSVSFPGNKSSILMAKLNDKGISVSNGSACGSGNIQSSPVLKAIGLNDKINLCTLRFSFGQFNTVNEIDYLLNELHGILK